MEASRAMLYAQAFEFFQQPSGALFLDNIQEMYAYNEECDTLRSLEELCDSCHDFTVFLSAALQRRDPWTQVRSYILYHRTANAEVAKCATLERGNSVAAFGLRGGNWHQLTRNLMSSFFDGLCETAGFVVSAEATRMTPAAWFAISPDAFSRAFDEAAGGNVGRYKRLTSKGLSKLRNELGHESIDIFRYTFEGGNQIGGPVLSSETSGDNLLEESENKKRRGRRSDRWLYDAWRSFWLTHRDSLSTSGDLTDFVSRRMHVKPKAAKSRLRELDFVASEGLRKSRRPR